MRTQGVFIFLITLLIIAVISLLLLSSMQHILLFHKAANRQEMQHQNFYQLEHVAMQLASKPLTAVGQNCVVHEDSANQVLERLLKHQGCSLANGLLQYHYFIEDLGELPCLRTIYHGNQHATHHKRVSVVQMNEETVASFLQI
ncbi:MAG: type II secretion system protein [Legionella sp.]